MPRSYKLKFSMVADSDLDAIYEYGFKEWGEQQADKYFDALTSHCNHLCDNPFLYAAVDDIRAGYRRSVCQAHSIFYRIIDDDIEIMSIIGRQDMEGRD